ncbi:MAG: hypothetical protein L0387_13660 [Acidobacteria bacterium]|nr:hypothetical protein [Acidobacteriota bacterium]MCI0622684.1 hypothetical protein [Acidobacteriota bacterium]MCI0720000.1 hypothetical protein [Acidobacteriota bacterium]
MIENKGLRHRGFLLATAVAIGSLMGLGITARAQSRIDPARLPKASPAAVDFLKDIKPIFENACLTCHNEGLASGGFRLDNQESALKGGQNGIEPRSGR